MAFFEYLFLVPANRPGFKAEGVPFNLVQLKVIQEAVTIIIFIIFATVFFKTEKLHRTIC